MDYLTSALRHYADFRGRCTRKPFWMFIVTTHVCLMLLLTPLLLVLTHVGTTLLVEQAGFGELVESLAQQGNVDEESLNELLRMGQSIAQEGKEILFAQHIPALVCAAAGVLLGLFLLVPSLSITVRRVRDAGQSPWWVYLSLMAFIPLPGVAELGSMLGLVVFIFCCLPSKEVTPRQTSA